MSAMGPAGRKLHIAHRRSPSELTPLMSKHQPEWIRTANFVNVPFLRSGTARHTAAD